ncbi:MAG: hypothetical protein A2X94_01895 [Bdellovibrionales bacterium GWB1_55_8]|nr:MAG: hypothetical protein A2X94_01895 [Bdellovibrionales bacterium GWB1_55_8]
MKDSEKFWHPYVAGVALGLVLLSSLVLMSKGLGASGAAHRLGVAALNSVASSHVDASAAMSGFKADGASPLDDWLIFEVLGALLGGWVAAYSAGRLKLGIQKGPNVSTKKRLVLALTGGIIMGIAARLARGCTSGQALTGGAMLSAGSWLFMFSVFAGGYALAKLTRRQWL